MTVPALIDRVLGVCQTFERYRGAPGRVRFFRERNSLVKAISRFGYVCHQRGWNFTADEIVKPILDVVISVRGREEEIKTYLPIYLQAAIDKHVRLKAEEYNAAAKAKKSVPAFVKKIVEGTTQVTAVREPTHTEILAHLHIHQRKTIKTNAAVARQRKAQKENNQQNLL